MAITTTYSHALPVLRERLVRAAHEYLTTAATVRERAASHARMHALAEAVEILGRSTDQTPVLGIADADYLPLGALGVVRAHFGPRADRLFGSEGTENGEPE